MSFKENLKSELEYQGLQLKELATRCGISKNTLGNYLTGHNSLPSAETAVKIAQSLGVSVEYLVTGTHQIETKNLLPIKYRRIIDVLTYLDDNDLEAVYNLATSLKKRYSPQSPQIT